MEAGKALVIFDRSGCKSLFTKTLQGIQIRPDWPDPWQRGTASILQDEVYKR